MRLGLGLKLKNSRSVDATSALEIVGKRLWKPDARRRRSGGGPGGGLRFHAGRHLLLPPRGGRW
jgi:hypothetical protein